MVRCSSCGRPVDKMPIWLEAVKVDFVCNNCPNRQAKNIAFVELTPEATPATKTAAPTKTEEPEEKAEVVGD